MILFPIAWSGNCRIHDVENPERNFPQRGKLFSMVWKNGPEVFHAVENAFPCPLPPASCLLSPVTCPLTYERHSR